ncbi:hypothetical protein S245_000352 [Arachis hypogaea]
MHLYNAWLPPPLAAQTAAERDSFRRVISDVSASFRPDDPESVFSTLKFISVLDLPTGQGLIRRGSELHLRVCRWPMSCCMHKAGFEPPTLA